jgi:hypothetical protein
MSDPWKHDGEHLATDDHNSEDAATVRIEALVDVFEETHPLAIGRDPYNQSVSDTAKRRTLADECGLSDEIKQDRKP